MDRVTAKKEGYCACKEEVQDLRAKRTEKNEWMCTFCGKPLGPEDAKLASERFWHRYGRFE